LNWEGMPSEAEYDAAFILKNGRDVHARMKRATVGIVGLGGLGSNISIMLARAGVWKFIIADYSNINLPNLCRQNFQFKDIGNRKTDVVEEMILNVNPYAKVEKHFVKVDATNASTIFSGCDVVCEAMDLSDEKTVFIDKMVNTYPNITIISGSGMAGYGRSNAIRTVQSLKQLYICGDMGDVVDRAPVIIAPRANICAGHVANTAIAVLMGEKV
jgi:thiamine biosynthesis protein ThiF, family 2